VTYDLNTPAVARLWPYGPDWSGGYQLTRSFLTDIATSRNNKEQRRALRDVPRISAAWRASIWDDDRRAADHWLRAAQNRPAVAANYARYIATTGSSSAGGSTLTIASPPAWIAEGQILVLCGDVHEAVVVDSVAGSTVTLTDTLANNWPSGSIVRPGLFGLLGGRTQATQRRRGALDLSLNLAVYPGGEPPEDEGAAATTFGGYEVFPDISPAWSGSPTLDYLMPVEQIDFGVGRTAQFRPIDTPQGLTEAEYGALTPAQALEIEQMFLRAKGRRGTFYRPTCEKDMVLNADASGTTFLATGNDLSDDFGSFDYSAEPAAIEIVQTNGTRLHRLVTDIAASGGNSQITVNASVTITVATTARISWMPLVRFASDDLTTDWRTPIAASIRTSFLTVQDDQATLS
jgi:hypothetical protein